MVEKIYSISDLPNSPAVYAFYGGRGRSSYVAYVGVTRVLKSRVIEHLVKRDRSVATGTTAVVLNPDFVTEVKWWEYPEFSDWKYLQAAELVAFDVFEPSLRSRGRIKKHSRQLNEDQIFRESMRDLFTSEPTGHLVILTLGDALAKIEELEQRILELGKRIP